MSPPIILACNNNTPTQSRQHPHHSAAQDHFSPGASRPNIMTRTVDLESTIEEWVDGLTSPLSTSPERISILNEIEKTLVTVTDPRRKSSNSLLPFLDQSAAMFWALQATAGYSLAEVLLAHIHRLHLDLERENEICKASQQHSSQDYGLLASASSSRLGSHGATDVQRQRVHGTVSEMCIAITILQGLTLCSKVSKRITQRKSALELLLQIVLSDYCTQLLPPILSPNTPTSSSFTLPDSPPTPTTSSPSKSNTDTANDAPLSLPSGFALDLLMCILVDSPLAQERFTDMGGIHQIVQLSHKCADTVTTPASTPVSVTSPSFAQAVARSGLVTALKQTDLLCLEFRYFWSQLLQEGEKERRPSQGRVISRAPERVESVVEEVVGANTPKASPRKRVSRTILREQRKAEEEEKVTPKATVRRRVAPITTRATSEEAPSRPSSSRTDSTAAGLSGSPRKLRHSTSVAELRKKPSILSRAGTSPPPLPPLPTAVTESPITFKPDPLVHSRRERTARPSTSDSQSSLPRERKEGARRSTFSDAPTAPSHQPEDHQRGGRNFNPSRPGMSSRDRPRIPSPLKARTSAQDVADQAVRLRRYQELAKSQAIPFRRLRASTMSTPFDPPQEDGDENRNPFASSENVVRSRGSSEVPLTPSTSQRSGGMSSANSTSCGGEKGRSSLSGSGAGMKIPPSPAVRRAQAARARSLSPVKMGLPLMEGGLREEF